MIVLDITHSDKSSLRTFIQQWTTTSDGKDMLCAALTDDSNVNVRAALDERGIAAAVSFTIYKDRVHVFFIGSIAKGAGSFLMDSVECLASALDLPVTTLAMKTAEGFYTKRGYKKVHGKKSICNVKMRKK